ncbi:cupin domain-containing protein [Microlunatus speluncae]|uniref:cupin domain-containing protein n=1 Tax=Microlunatus speluncae TaxID=2594267 RepID=UPI0012666226|nr:cupin domain-containing protein [Microlunatus speluncae]
MNRLPVEITEGERLALGTDELIVLATTEQTGGALFSALIRMPPGGGPPVLHRHAPGEIYHVLEGEFVFYVGDKDRPDGPVRRHPVRAGEVMPLAGDTPHTIRNESDADAVAFMVHAPGAAMEGFSRAAAALAAAGEPSMEAVLEIAATHGIELLGPVVVATDAAAAPS